MIIGQCNISQWQNPEGVILTIKGYLSYPRSNLLELSKERIILEHKKYPQCQALWDV